MNCIKNKEKRGFLKFFLLNISMAIRYSKIVDNMNTSSLDMEIVF